MNPFPYSDDNKRYQTWKYYTKHKFHQDLYRVALNASFTCPNRDGTKGIGGCTYCGTMGGGEFGGNQQDPLLKQFDDGVHRLQEKHPNSLFMPYFQAYTNTYAPLSTLQKIYDPFMKIDSIPALCIATRSDCLEENKIHYFNELAKHKEIWLEIGLQTMHDTTAKYIHRGHDVADFLSCIEKLRSTNIKICVHIINSLPYETYEMMMDTARLLATLPIHAIKIHMLYIQENTQMAQDYKNHPFPLLSREDYVDLLIHQLEILPSKIIIQRLSGDGPQDKVRTPLWTKNKLALLNEIDKEMDKRNTWQGKQCKQ